MKFTIYQETRIGKRANNEDRLAHCYSRDALLTVVADGMGGHYYGEVAAQIAVQTLTEAFKREFKPRIRDPFMFLQKGMLNAHRGILDFAGKHHLQDSPRTTCVACIVQNNVAYWAHSGDSRLYLLRNGKVLAQTKDHSRVRLLVDQGVITEDEVLSHPDRNKIYGCLGGQQTPEVTFSHKVTLEAGDVLVLCTDGAWSGLPGDILAIALKTADLLRAVPLLLGQAEARGGPTADNLSMIAVRWQDTYSDGSSGGSSVISTRTMPRDTVTTKMDEFGRNPQSRTELTEAEIERAIEEIRSTIQKYK
ncbi:protein phosphatase 2C domain-containing protein [Accumulibacter sp.]|jgi:serine/threonine protein phosphatase PrpC|uniref:Protein serine/threonine phosphatase n=1 Tax=Accumulibacter regalis TaxID=522306 RepID=C7RPN0_ACCRE|nr:protein phosphatase 2C domain-containing protein [Accumulibacter sp.]MBN8496643.1 serine/threonine-protein phosphatase [Accumulibacter sp.]MBO3714258.1 serine/threonine-protein phosphatase [Accumulibacter sp.]